MSAMEQYPRIAPFLWFDANAEEAVEFYLSVFKNSRKLNEVRMPSDQSSEKSRVLTVAFELDGQKFTALNGGPTFKFTEAISFVVRCETQDEVDYYWSKLSAGGSDVSISNIPFLRNVPVEDLRPGGHLKGLQRNVPLDQA